jgi:hypothetical protein
VLKPALVLLIAASLALSSLLLSSLYIPAVAYADVGTGAFEGYTVTKLAGIDSIHKALAGNMNATKPFVDTIDWYGKNETESFFIFRYCPDPQNCVIGAATPDGRAIAKAFDPPSKFTSLAGAKISPRGNALLFRSTYSENKTAQDDLYIFIKGGTSLIQLTNNTQVASYSWLPDGNVTFSSAQLTIGCAQGSTTTCNEPQYNYDSTIVVAMPTGERTRTLFQDHSSIVDYAISPDGKKIAFSSFQGNPADPKKEWRLSVYDMTSGSTKVLFSNRDGHAYSTPRWAPSGEAILYTTVTAEPIKSGSSNNNTLSTSGWLNLADLDGKELGRAVFAGSDKGAVPFGTAVTGDGQHIIFAIDQNVSGDGIDGQGIYRITLAHPIPEFPFANLVAVAAIGAAIAVAARMRAKPHTSP